MPASFGAPRISHLQFSQKWSPGQAQADVMSCKLLNFRERGLWGWQLAWSVSMESQLRFCVGLTVPPKNFLNRREQLDGSDRFGEVCIHAGG